MEAKELMIGDWVLLRHTHTKEKTAEYVYGIGRDVILYRNEAGVQCVDMNLIEPMPLTEEILLKNGFTLDEEWEEYRAPNKTYFGLEYTVRKESYYITIASYFDPIFIKYVHELQHLLRLCGLNDLADNFKIE